MNLADLIWATGSNNSGGIQQAIYIVNAADCTTIPDCVETDPLASSGSLADLATIADDLVLAAGKSMKKVYVTLEEGELKFEPQGEMDGKSFKNSLSILHPGNKPEALGFLSYIKNGSFIILAADLDGNKRMLGTKAYPAKVVEAGGTTGKGSAARKHSTITFQSCGNTPAPVFTGDVLVVSTPQTIDFD